MTRLPATQPPGTPARPQTLYSQPCNRDAPGDQRRGYGVAQTFESVKLGNSMVGADTDDSKEADLTPRRWSGSNCSL